MVSHNRGSRSQAPEAEAHALLDLNLGSTVSLCRLYGADFAAKQDGRILITGSLTALAPLPGASLYGATKAFLRSFTEGIRQELAPSRVSVTLLSPGATDSGFAAAGKMEQSLAFTLPLGRTLGLVLSAEAVATAGLRATLAGEAEVVPGLLNGAYTRAVWMMPQPLAASFASLFFDPRVNPLADFGAFGRALPVLLAGAPLVVLCTAVEILSVGARLLAATWTGCLLLVLILLSLTNALQNGPLAPHTPPPCSTVEEAMALRRKRDFVAVWRAAAPPTGFAGHKYDAKLVPLGVTARVRRRPPTLVSSVVERPTVID